MFCEIDDCTLSLNSLGIALRDVLLLIGIFRMAWWYLNLSEAAVALKSPNFLQQVLSEHEPDTPWHLQRSFIVDVTAWMPTCKLSNWATSLHNYNFHHHHTSLSCRSISATGSPSAGWSSRKFLVARLPCFMLSLQPPHFHASRVASGLFSDAHWHLDIFPSAQARATE